MSCPVVSSMWSPSVGTDIIIGPWPLCDGPYCQLLTHTACIHKQFVIFACWNESEEKIIWKKTRHIGMEYGYNIVRCGCYGIRVM